MRVDPAIGSAPVRKKMAWSDSMSSGVSALLAMPTVKAPRCLASRTQASVKGVVPLAATATSTSLASTR